MPEIKKISDGQLMAAARVWNSFKYFLCEHLTIRISLFFYWFWLLFVVPTLLVSIFCSWPLHCNSRGYISASRQWH